MNRAEKIHDGSRKGPISYATGRASGLCGGDGFQLTGQMSASSPSRTASSGVTFDRITETMYLLVLGLYLLKSSFETTLFYLPWPKGYEAVVFILACGVVMLRVGRAQKYGGLCCLLCVGIGIVFKLSWQHTEYNYLFLLYIPLFIIGAMGIEYKKILKVSFLINFATLAAAFIGSCLGVVGDLVYEIDSSHRHSFGIMYTTDFAARVFYLLLAGWVLYEGVPAVVNLFVAMFSAWFVYRYCQAKCGEIILLLLTLCILYEYITRKAGRQEWLPIRIIDSLCVWCAPICAAGIICLSLFYEEKVAWMSNLDGILTQRLSLSHKAMNQYGFTLFGTAFAQEGNGGTTAYNFFYNFIDSSYILILLRYGAIVFAMFMMLYVYQGRLALREGRRRLLLAGALVAVHSAIEHHMPELNYNIFIALPLASFRLPSREKEEVSTGMERKTRLRMILAMVPVTVLLLLLAPSMVGYMRTLVHLLEYHEYINGIQFILWSLAVSIVVYVFLRNVRIILFCPSRRGRGLRGTAGLAIFRNAAGLAMFRNVAGLIIPAVVILAVFLASKGVMRDGMAEYETAIQNEKKLLESVIESSHEELSFYMSDVPWLYQKEIKGVTDRFLPVEACETEENVVLVTPIETELNHLLRAGYLFGSLSSVHGIYTNSQDAVNKLRAMGIEMSDYYNVYRPIDMEALAEANDLEMNEDGSLFLSGKEKSIYFGPRVPLSKGRYQITFDVQLERADSYELAEARVTSDNGRTWWEGKEVTWADFDDGGHGVIQFDINFWCDVNNAEFLLLAEDQIEMFVNDIECRKVGNIKEGE